jgi:6,7-dimethyl-8-ribityllumazine synthase
MAASGRPEPRAVDAAGLSLGIVAARWHAEITDQLLARAIAAAKSCGVQDPVTVRVEGALELPVVAQLLARRHDAVVCLGAVIRGATAHFGYVCAVVGAGLAAVALRESVPIGHGILTCDTFTQAVDRSGLPTSSEDKGWEATVAALDAAIVLCRLREVAE